jgi:hypothetical protein
MKQRDRTAKLTLCVPGKRVSAYPGSRRPEFESRPSRSRLARGSWAGIPSRVDGPRLAGNAGVGFCATLLRQSP